MPLTVLSYGSDSELGPRRRADAPWSTSPWDTNKPLIVFLKFFFIHMGCISRHEDRLFLVSCSDRGPCPAEREKFELTRSGPFTVWPLKLQTACTNILWQRPKPGELPTCWRQKSRSGHPWCHQCIIFQFHHCQENSFKVLTYPWYLYTIILK